jgi:hypothetical protein
MFDALEERELELLRERNLPTSHAHTPGGELSGIFRAVKERDVDAIRSNPDLKTIIVINALGVLAVVGLLFAILLVVALG